MPLRKSLFFLAFLGIAFLFDSSAQAACVDVNASTGECVVTSSGGDLTDGGLSQCLTDPRCQKITFGVDHVDPLIEIVEVRAGLELDGRVAGGGRIVLTYNEDFAWTISPGDGTCPPEPVDHRTCLLRIMPVPQIDSTAGVTVSNLIIENRNGAGICLLSCNGEFTNGNRISNVVVHAGGQGRGIDLGLSNGNTLQNVTILGLSSTNPSGIYIQGDDNHVLGGRIERFENGVFITSTGTSNTVGQIDFLRIRNRPIQYSNGRSARPREVLKAFVTPNDFTLTGIVHSSAEGLEVYKYEETMEGKNYLYAGPLPVQNFYERGASGRSRLTTNDKRFVAPINEQQSDLDSRDSTAVVGTVLTSSASGTRTTEFSDPTPAETIIQGHPRCNNTVWFWPSYDYAVLPGTERGWDVDYDLDGLVNDSEDADRDCRVDTTESDPADWRSQYDFDCDGLGDHQYIGFRARDNCFRFHHPDGSEYPEEATPAERLATICRDPADPANAERFLSWNPDQLDSDGDNLGDACENDPDNDGLVTGLDNCPAVYNPNQRNSDEREDRTRMPPLLGRAGDACEQILGMTPANAAPGDADGDGRSNLQDNCPFDANHDQTDTDSDKVGDACDFDDDNDGLMDREEDFNGDGVVDAGETNSKSPDTDFDTICDGPGWGFTRISCIRPLDNCPRLNNREQIDRDEDGIGDLCDANSSLPLGNVDSDGDGVADALDNCPTHPNDLDILVERGFSILRQNDGDLDTLGDPCDADDDNDGLDDAAESGIFDPRRRDFVNPYRPNSQRNDADGDGFVDGIDVCPNHPFACENLEDPNNPECVGVIDNPTGDPNVLPESFCGGYPLNDLDGDGRRNREDNCVFVPNSRQLDLDADGKGDACDLDDDNDDNVNAETDECRDYLRGLIDPLTGVAPALIQARNVGVGLVFDFPTRRHCDFDESANLRLHPWDPNSDHERGHIFSFADRKCDGGGRGFGFVGGLNRCEPADPCPEFFNAPGSERFCGAGMIAPDIVLPDFDSDLVPNQNDSCPNDPNPDQADLNRDGVGDACDDDRDGDGILNASDNCPDVINSDQTDTDGDAVPGLGLGDACDANPFTKNVAQVQGTGVTVGGCSLAVYGAQNKLLFPLSKGVIMAPWIWLLGVFLIILRVKGTPRSIP